jgi:hypothetical protein
MISTLITDSTGMNTGPIKDFSCRLKEIAKDLSFLGHPRYPLQKLIKLFPQHHSFINELQDVSVPFNVNVANKRRAMDIFLKDLAKSEVPYALKEVFTRRIEDYHTLLSMMENFDNVFFYDHCTKLYGTSHKSTQNNAFFYFLEKIPEYCVPDRGEKKT